MALAPLRLPLLILCTLGISLILEETLFTILFFDLIALGCRRIIEEVAGLPHQHRILFSLRLRAHLDVRRHSEEAEHF